MPPRGERWSGPEVTAARVWMSQFLPLPCHRCGRVVLPEHRWQIDHIVSRAVDPSLTWDRDNWAVSHGKCNEAAGSRLAAARARGAVTVRTASSAEKWAAPTIEETWDDVADWGFAPPHFFSEPHPNAVATLFDRYKDEAQELLRLQFLPWQSLVLGRGLEIDASDELCWRRVVVSVSRQSGKSTGLLRPLAVIRALWARDLDSPQFTLHVARRREAAKKLLVRPDAVRLAENAGIDVRQGNGTERWLWEDGTLWQVFAVSGVYGETANLVLADECWDVSDDEFNEGIVPTMTESERGQLWMVSAAHEDATELMLKERAQAMKGTGSAMIAEWSASPDDDPFDPRTWWSASPRWTRSRFETIRDASSNRSILTQYLNVWPSRGPAAGAALAFPGWAGLPMAPEQPPPGAVGAVERAAPGMGWGVAAAAALGDGRFGLWTRVVDTLPAAEAWLGSWGVVWAVAGASFAPDMTVPAEAATSTTLRAALPNVIDLVDQGRVVHDHNPRALEQFARCQRTDTDMGVIISAKRSGGPIAVVKAAVWAVEAARRFESENPAVY